MRGMRLLAALVLGSTVLLVTGGLRGNDDKQDKIDCQIIYVPTEIEVVEKMLDMAKVGKDDVVYDLGCGDGRIVAVAAKKFGARGVGVDIDPDRIRESHETLKKYGVEKLVEIRKGDALKVKDLNKATVVMLYMLAPFMEKLEPIAQKTLKPGTRIVAHDFPFPNWKAEQTVSFKGPSRQHHLYLYVVKSAPQK
jgi:cyclopropane fatty-acyl-phospholipid synthase-like methyltransferase